MATNKKINKGKIKGNFLDYTDNFGGVINDGDNLTGISVDFTGKKTEADLGQPTTKEIIQGLSNERYQQIEGLANDPGEQEHPEKHTISKEASIHAIDNLEKDATGNGTLNESVSPEMFGEQSVSGDMPDPASDDDTLKNAQYMGFALDAESDHPKPLDMASDIDKAEEEHRLN